MAAGKEVCSFFKKSKQKTIRKRKASSDEGTIKGWMSVTDILGTTN